MRTQVLAQIALSALTGTAIASSDLTKRTTPATLTEFRELSRAAKLSSGAYTACNPVSFDINVTKILNDSVTDTQGYVGYSDALKRISVVMKGSTAPKDFQNDVDTNMTVPVLSGVDFPAGVQIMHGLYVTWNSVHDQVISEVKRLLAVNPSYELESTGHSLGGALTYMSYIALSRNFPDKAVTSNALAAFQIGNQAFADFGTAQKGLLRRGNNLLDGVPNIYPQMVHFGVEFYGNGTLNTTVKCNGELDTACSAGNGQKGITPQHLFNSGVKMGRAGCTNNATEIADGTATTDLAAAASSSSASTNNASAAARTIGSSATVLGALAFLFAFAL